MSLTSCASLTFEYLFYTYKVSDLVLGTGVTAIIKTGTLPSWTQLEEGEKH